MKAALTSFLNKVNLFAALSNLPSKIRLSNLKQFWQVNKKLIIIAAIIIALAAIAGYRMAEKYEINTLGSLKGAAISVFSTSKQFVLDKAKLSTGTSENVGEEGSASEEIPSPTNKETNWEIRKAEKGQSLWRVYQLEISARADIAHKNQTINGLKNLTILKNNIPVEKLKNNSMTEGNEYQLLSKASESSYVSKLTEANQKLKAGASLKTLDKDLQTAYLIANAPSYEFLMQMPHNDLGVFLEAVPL